MSDLTELWPVKRYYTPVKQKSFDEVLESDPRTVHEFVMLPDEHTLHPDDAADSSLQIARSPLDLGAGWMFRLNGASWMGSGPEKTTRWLSVRSIGELQLIINVITGSSVDVPEKYAPPRPPMPLIPPPPGPQPAFK